jgi:hypothetical protein
MTDLFQTAAVDAWMKAHDAALADLTARHDAHKARLAAVSERVDALRDGATL